MSFDRIKGYIEPVLWITGTALTVLGVFKAGGFYTEIKSDWEMVEQVAEMAPLILERQADGIAKDVEQDRRLKVMAQSQKDIKALIKNLYRVKDIDSESGE